MNKEIFIQNIITSLNNVGFNYNEYRVEYSIKFSPKYIRTDRVNIQLEELGMMDISMLQKIMNDIIGDNFRVMNFINEYFNLEKNKIDALGFGYDNGDIEIYFQGEFGCENKSKKIISLDVEKNKIFEYKSITDEKIFNINDFINFYKKYNIELSTSHISDLEKSWILKKENTYHFILFEELEKYLYFFIPLFKKINSNSDEGINYLINNFKNEKISVFSFNPDEEFITLYFSRTKNKNI